MLNIMIALVLLTAPISFVHQREQYYQHKSKRSRPIQHSKI